MGKQSKIANDNISFWNRFARIYDIRMRKDQKAYLEVADKIKSYLNHDMTVLELATGTGLLAIQIADSCKAIEATDYSPEMIAVAKQKANPNNLIFAVQDATALTYADNSYDVVIISNALHIMPDPIKALENIKRVLKPDGIMVAPTFVRNKTFSEWLFTKPMELVGFKTFSKWSYDEYIVFLKENGFNILHSEVIKARLPIAFVAAQNGGKQCA